MGVARSVNAGCGERGVFYLWLFDVLYLNGGLLVSAFIRCRFMQLQREALKGLRFYWKGGKRGRGREMIAS